MRLSHAPANAPFTYCSDWYLPACQRGCALCLFRPCLFNAKNCTCICTPHCHQSWAGNGCGGRTLGSGSEARRLAVISNSTLSGQNHPPFSNNNASSIEPTIFATCSWPSRKRGLIRSACVGTHVRANDDGGRQGFQVVLASLPCSHVAKQAREKYACVGVCPSGTAAASNFDPLRSLHIATHLLQAPGYLIQPLLYLFHSYSKERKSGLAMLCATIEATRRTLA